VRHNELDREFPCDGELIETGECTQTLVVRVCLKCFTAYRYTTDSSWVTVTYPGMRQSLDWKT